MKIQKPEKKHRRAISTLKQYPKESEDRFLDLIDNSRQSNFDSLNSMETRSRRISIMNVPSHLEDRRQVFETPILPSVNSRQNMENAAQSFMVSRYAS